jgi:hypothetical protein
MLPPWIHFALRLADGLAAVPATAGRMITGDCT